MANTSMYVAKADGTREQLDDVQLEMAREIFLRMDWDRELRVVQAAQEARELAAEESASQAFPAVGDNDVYVPEFGLTDEEERLLVVTPVSSEAVTVWIQCPAFGWGIDSFPKSEVSGLLERYFAGDDGGLQEIAARHQPARELLLHLLSAAEFQATMAGQMRWVGEVETYNQVRLRDYLSACLDALALPASLETIELTNIYRSADDRHSHIHFNYGEPPTALVLVVQHDAEAGDSVIGHHLLDLTEGTYLA
jgi:hypothetical protein